MKRTLLLLLLLASLPAAATTRYIAATAGTFTGGTACNGHTAITAATWNSTTEAAGDISYVCGTITGTGGANILTMSWSGTSGNPITLFFDTGAIVQAPYCATGVGGSQSACVVVSGQFDVVDGQNTGLIQATLNGSPGGSCPGGTCTTQNGGDGVWVSNNNDTVQNLTIANLYVHTNGGTDNFPSSSPIGIEISNGQSNILIHNNTIHDQYTGIEFTESAAGSNYVASNNTIYHTCWGMSVPQEGAGVNYTGIYIVGNHVYDHSSVNGTASCHANALHIFQGSACTTCTVTGFYLYNNEFDGPVSSTDTTAQLYTDQNGANTTIINGYYFNNIMSFAPGDCSGTCDAAFTHANGSPSFIYNNTYLCNATGTTQQAVAIQTFVLTGLDARNNVITNCQMAMQSKGSTWSSNTNFNYYGNSGFGFGNSSDGACCISFATWKTDTGADANSVSSASTTILPACNSSTDCSNVAPTSGSPVIGFGQNLNSICTGQPNPGLGALCFDKAGNSRPSSGAWTAGAFNLSGSGSGSFTCSPTTIPANHSGNISLACAGTSTSWTGSTAFSISGVTGATLVSSTNHSATSETLVVTTGSGTGTLTLTDTTDSISTAITVATATLSISPTSGATGTTPTLTLTGANTLWTTETAAGLFSESGGTGASIGTPTVTSDTAATATLTVGSASGTLTITDTSTTATASFTASPNFALTVTVVGGGSVTSSPAGINCPGTCSHSYTTGTVVTLTPVASTMNLFINWSTCSFSGTCAVTMSAAKAVTANFCNPNSSSFCNNQTAQSTSFSIASGIVTIAASNTFPNPGYFGISRCTVATQLNGQVLLTNSSTSTTQVVGTLYDMHLSALSPSNVSTTADATCFLQGQGWQPWVTAPFPAPGSPNCALGNGSPGCTLPAASAGFGPNTWAYDPSIPCSAFNTAPCAPMVMLADTSYTTAHAAMLPSLAGETNERVISLSDGSTPPNYMYALNHSAGALEVFSGHVDPTFCGGAACFISDVQGEANSWHQNPINYGLFSRNPANNPGPHKALWYTLNMNSTCGISGSPDCSIAPVLQAVTLQYFVGLPNCSAAGVSCVQAISTVNVYAINTCPDYGHLLVGDGLAVASQIQIDNFDNHIMFSVAGATQGDPGRHSVFVISMASSPMTCMTWNTDGTVGTDLHDLEQNSAHQGAGYAVNDTFSFTEASGVCASTGKVVAIGTGGSVTNVAIVSGAASGCYLARGWATTATSGSGIGLQVDVAGVGSPGTFGTTFAPISSAACPAGNNTTITCESAVTSVWNAFGLHNCNMTMNAASYVGCGGPGSGGPGPSGAVVWQPGTSTLVATTNPNLGGHGAPGFNWVGNASNPNYFENRPLAGLTDVSCTNPADCYILYTLPPCAGSPGGSQLHSTQPTIFNDDSQPVYVTSSVNSPGAPTQTNPPGFKCGLGQQSLFTISKTGNAYWYNHWYENGNNAVTSPPENFEGSNNIMSCAPDGVLCIGATDMNHGFPGNTGLGVDNTGTAAYVGVFSVLTIPQTNPPGNNAPSAPSFVLNNLPALSYIMAGQE